MFNTFDNFQSSRITKLNIEYHKLGELVSIVKGKKHNNVFDAPINNSKRYIQIDDLRNNDNPKYTTDEGVEVNNNDIIIAWDGANAGTIGFNISGYIGSTLARLRLKTTDIYPKYLGRFLRGNSSHIRQNCYGATIPHVSKSFLESIKIPLPPLPIQKKIAEVLERADAAREKRRQANALTEQFLRSVLLEMFGDPVRNPKEWKVLTVKELALKEKHAIKAGPFGSSLKKEYYVSRGYKIYGQEQVIRDDLNYGDYYISSDMYIKLEAYKIREGDILISLVGTYGKISIVPQKFEPGIINPRLMKITLDSSIMKPIVFKHIIQSNSMKSMIDHKSHGGTMDIMNLGLMKELRIYVPPIELQEKYEKLVEKIQLTILRQKRSEEELENLFQSLMQKAFKGELKFNDKELV